MSTMLATDPATAQILPTSLDPYGQLFRMLMPRALCIAIYDRSGMGLWTSDGCESAELGQLVQDAFESAASSGMESDSGDGFARSWDGESAYVFMLRDETMAPLGAVAMSCNDGNGTGRPFSTVHGLLRPALEVLRRELASQCSIGDLQKDLTVRDGDLELLLGAADAAHEAGSDDFGQLVHNCVKHLDCALGALLIPDKNIAVCRTGEGVPPATGADVLTRTHRHLLAWSQVQRRTMALNRTSAQTPLGAMPYKILSCPVFQGAQRVVGILALFKAADQPDFDLRQIRIVELLARRVTHVLQNAYDPTTGLLTRPAFEKRALALLAACTAGASHSVIYADLDRLHVVNETHGMHVGDEVITRMADVIRGNLPSRTIAARISGDRFALFLPESELDDAEKLANTLCSALERLAYMVEQKTVEVSASFGVASVKPTKHPLSHALAEAEAACKAAKDRGRGRVEIYQDGDHSIIRRYEDVLLIGSVRDAIANNRFRLEAQPIVDLRGLGRERRFELLLRMIDSNGDSIAPAKFLLAAERYQLAPAIDRWVVQYVLEVVSAGAARLRSIGAHFAVNISGQSLGDDEFPGFLEDKLRSYALPPELISFELTETAAVSNIVRAESLMRKLRDLGHEIALDDFGRGLSSLTYLKSLPVSYLKIDGDLIRDVVGNPRSQAMVGAVVQLARAMKLRTTAECIESDAIRRTVADLDVDFGQGFSIGRPRPFEPVLQELLKSAGTRPAESDVIRLVG